MGIQRATVIAQLCPGVLQPPSFLISTHCARLALQAQLHMPTNIDPGPYVQMKTSQFPLALRLRKTDTVKHPVQAAVAAAEILPQLPVAVQDHGKAVVAGGVAAEVEAAGHHVYVLPMLVGICIEDVLVPERECPLGIVEADDLVSVSAEGCGPDTIQVQQQHASIEPKLTIVWQAAAVPCKVYQQLYPASHLQCTN